MNTESQVRISDTINAVPNLSAPNASKWDASYAVLQSEFKLPQDKLYLTYINKASNAQVRLSKQIPHQPHLAIGVCGTSDADSSSYPRQAERVLSDRPELECVVFLFKDQAGESWIPKLIFGKPGSAIVERVREVWPSVNVSLLSGPNVRAIDTEPNGASEVDARDSRSQAVIDLLLRHRNVVLEGVPGTGKTHAVKRIVADWDVVSERPLAKPTIIVLHPSSAYEDLVEGLRPVAEVPHYRSDGVSVGELGSVGRFAPTLGRLAEACQRAIDDPDHDHLLVLDEFNRANVPRVLGEFLLLLEDSRRAVRIGNVWQPQVDGMAQLTYSGQTFFVPDNLYLLATMNTSDASVATLDSALRRRFVFMRLEPLTSEELLDRLPGVGPVPGPGLRRVVEMWNTMNRDLLQPLLGPDAMLGHSYFFVLADALRSEALSAERAIAEFLRYSYLPQLIDVLSLHGREELVARDLVSGITPEAVRALAILRETLKEFDLALEVFGSGLGRKIVVSDAALRSGRLLEVLASEDSGDGTDLEGQL